MPLPAGGQGVTWPPKSEAAIRRVYEEHAAWYSGDPARLAEVYGGTAVTPAPLGRVPWWKSWARANTAQYSVQQRAQLHVPIAGEIAQTSAALLFTEAPDFTIGEAEPGKDANGDAIAAPPDAIKAQERLEQLLHEGGVHARLLEAAETAAAMSGVYLKPTWDEDLVDHPLLAVVQVDSAVPEFQWGILKAVTFYREVVRDGQDVIRHLERHERAGGDGYTLHALYRGTVGELGRRMSNEELKLRTGLEPSIKLPFKSLGVRYVPNMRPNRRWRDRAEGQSDYAGSEGLLDALDETWASWMRDIRLGKARIMVPEDFLLPDRRFDVDHEVFTPLDMQPGSSGAQITAQQFQIRYEEHNATTLAQVERIVSNAGYSPQTFGLHIEGQAESGTALNIREKRSYFTRARKAGWFGPVVADLAEMMLAIDRTLFGHTDHGVYRPDVELPEGSPAPGEVAATLQAIRAAEAASTETLVRMLHPDWDEQRVQDETDRIIAERGSSVPNPGGFGGGGADAFDVDEGTPSDGEEPVATPPAE